MKLPTVRDFYREAMEEYQEEFEESCGFWERPNRAKRLELLTEAQAKWDSMMEAYGEWQPKNVYQQDDPHDD